MKQYRVTAKLHIDVEAQSEQEAHNTSKAIIDDAMHEYLDKHTQAKDSVGISKAKVVWVKDSTYELQTMVDKRYAGGQPSQVGDKIHPAQRKIVELIQSEGIKSLTLREIGQRIGVRHPNSVKYHLWRLERLGEVYE